MKLNAAQDKLLEQLAAADREWREAQISLEARIRADLEKQLEQTKIKRDLLAFRCDEAGVPRRQIAMRGLDTSAAITAREAIANGALYVPKAEEDAAPAKSPVPEFARLGDDVVRITPTPADLSPILSLIDVPESAVAGTDLEFADVRLVDGNIIPITEPWSDQHDVRHPVVALLSDPTYRARVKEFAA